MKQDRGPGTKRLTADLLIREVVFDGVGGAVDLTLFPLASVAESSQPIRLPWRSQPASVRNVSKSAGAMGHITNPRHFAFLT